MNANEVHICLVVGIQGTDIAPVIAVSIRRTGNIVVLEVVVATHSTLNEPRNDIPTHIVLRQGVLSIFSKRGNQILSGEDVVAHRGQNLGGIVLEADWVLWLLNEAIDVAILAFDYTEGRCYFDGLANSCDGCGKPGIDVVLDHL